MIWWVAQTKTWCFPRSETQHRLPCPPIMTQPSTRSMSTLNIWVPPLPLSVGQWPPRYNHHKVVAKAHRTRRFMLMRRSLRTVSICPKDLMIEDGMHCSWVIKSSNGGSKTQSLLLNFEWVQYNLWCCSCGQWIEPRSVPSFLPPSPSFPLISGVLPPALPLSTLLPPASAWHLTWLGRHHLECIIVLVSHHPSPLAKEARQRSGWTFIFCVERKSEITC